MGVTNSNQFLRGHEDQRECALELRHGKAHGILDGIRLQPRLCDEICDDLGVARAVEDRAALFKHAAQSACVAEVAVVDKRHLALLVIDLHRLTVAPLIAARRAVARVPDGDRTLRKCAEHSGCKHMVNEPEILMRIKHAVVIDRDAGALLPAVLQGK